LPLRGIYNAKKNMTIIADVREGGGEAEEQQQKQGERCV
jgi:hypothetical protein